MPKAVYLPSAIAADFGSNIVSKMWLLPKVGRETRSSLPTFTINDANSCSKNIVHLHGELTKVRSERFDHLIYELTPDRYEVKIGDKCEKGFQLRPHIVWFGEAVPMLEEAVRLAQKADIFVVVGTSLNVYPAASLVHYVQPEVPVYVVDPNSVAINDSRWHYIRLGASEGMKEFIKQIQPYI